MTPIDSISHSQGQVCIISMGIRESARWRGAVWAGVASPWGQILYYPGKQSETKLNVSTQLRNHRNIVIIEVDVHNSQRKRNYIICYDTKIYISSWATLSMKQHRLSTAQGGHRFTTITYAAMVNGWTHCLCLLLKPRIM